VADPALASIAAVAKALGPLRERVVFIGGSLAPLLQIEPPFAAVRPTGDVDAIAVTTSYTDFERLRQDLRQRGFVESTNARHANRWILTSQGIDFDLMPAGDHFGGSGNPWDRAALESTTETEIEPGVSIRHVDAPGFLALKLAAYSDRGSEDPFGSHDLEDILALVASRVAIVQEVLRATPQLRQFISKWFQELLQLGDEFEDMLAAHLGNVARGRRGEILENTRRRLEQIAAPDKTSPR
jgi:predicted nucleotidyltransferase